MLIDFNYLEKYKGDNDGVHRLQNTNKKNENVNEKNRKDFFGQP